jgi:hypothetical protein
MSKGPGWDAKAIGEIAARHYGNFTIMFERNGWPERGQDMMRKVQSRVKEDYGSIAAFVAKHEAGE